MRKTVKKMRIGSRLILGSYAPSCSEPEPIVWLKATPNCDFISEFVLDCLCVDAPEPHHGNGNGNYSLSNMRTFANSAEELWYAPTHEFDNPPDFTRNIYGYGAGFLHGFEMYEIHSLEGEVRLPAVGDIFGEARFNLFSKKGARAAASVALSMKKRGYFDLREFVPFWTSSEVDITGYGGRLSKGFQIIGKDSGVRYQYPGSASGFRPVCSVKEDSVVEETADGLYRLLPPVGYTAEAIPEEDLYAFLGLTLPLTAS